MSSTTTDGDGVVGALRRLATTDYRECQWCTRTVPTHSLTLVPVPDEPFPLDRDTRVDSLAVCPHCAPGDDPEDADERGCVVP